MPPSTHTLLQANFLNHVWVAEVLSLDAWSELRNGVELRKVQASLERPTLVKGTDAPEERTERGSKDNEELNPNNDHGEPACSVLEKQLRRMEREAEGFYTRVRRDTQHSVRLARG